MLFYCRLTLEPDITTVSTFKFKHFLSHTAQYYKHSFFIRTVPEWNSLPEACVNADTITAFQAQLRHTHSRDTRKWSDDY